MDHNNSANNETINLLEIAKSITKNWYIFVISIVCCVALAFLYSKVRKEQYVVISNVMIRTDNSSMSNVAGAFMQQMGVGNLLGETTTVDDEIHVISSHTLLRETAQKMQLNKTHIYKENFINRWVEHKDFAVDVLDPNHHCDTLSITLLFKVKIDEDGLADIKVKKGFFKTFANMKNVELPATINTIYGDYIVEKTPFYEAGKDYNYTIKVCSFDKRAEDIAEEIDIYIPDKMANVISMIIETPYISYGKELLNTITTLYNKKGIDIKNIEATNTANFIDERLKIIESELADAEEKVELYKKKHNLSDLEMEAKAIIESNVHFRTKLIESETHDKIIDYTISFINQPQNQYELIPFSLEIDDSSNDPINEYNTLCLKRINMLSTAKPGSPALKLIENQIDASRTNVISSLKNAKEASAITLDQLRKEEAKFMGRLTDMPTQEREFMDVYRQKVIKEELYIFLLQKQEENAITLAVTSPKGQLIDEAFNLNKPSTMSTKMLLFVGFILGLILPMIYLYVKYLFRTKFSTKEELEKITQIPILGEMCINYNKEKVVVREGDTSSISELFRLLRTNLQFLLTGKKDTVVLLTSSVSGEGKSFISVNLAASLALLNKRVIIIGLDIRNPQLAAYMGLRSRLGVTNYLASEDVNLDDIIIPSGINPQLDVIVAGPIPPNPAELLLGSRLDELIGTLRDRYDYIIIDSAPVAMVSDTFSLMRVSDTVVYVCRANYTLREHIQYCNELVAEERLRNVSLVINATTAKQGYGYGYNQNGERVRMHK